VKRAIQAELIQVMANQLLRGVFEEDDTIIVSADKDGLALTSGPKIVRETPKDEGDSDDDVPAPARKPAFMNVMNGSSMGQFMGGAPNGGGDGGGFL
jgi:hypothetical protein